MSADLPDPAESTDASRVDYPGAMLLLVLAVLLWLTPWLLAPVAQPDLVRNYYHSIYRIDWDCWGVSWWGSRQPIELVEGRWPSGSALFMVIQFSLAFSLSGLLAAWAVVGRGFWLVRAFYAVTLLVAIPLWTAVSEDAARSLLSKRAFPDLAYPSAYYYFTELGVLIGSAFFLLSFGFFIWFARWSRGTYDNEEREGAVILGRFSLIDLFLILAAVAVWCASGMRLASLEPEREASQFIDIYRDSLFSYLRSALFRGILDLVHYGIPQICAIAAIVYCVSTNSSLARTLIVGVCVAGVLQTAWTVALYLAFDSFGGPLIAVAPMAIIGSLFFALPLLACQKLGWLQFNERFPPSRKLPVT